MVPDVVFGEISLMLESAELDGEFFDFLEVLLGEDVENLAEFFNAAPHFIHVGLEWRKGRFAEKTCNRSHKLSFIA